MFLTLPFIILNHALTNKNWEGNLLHLFAYLIDKLNESVLLALKKKESYILSCKIFYDALYICYINFISDVDIYVVEQIAA